MYTHFLASPIYSLSDSLSLNFDLSSKPNVCFLTSPLPTSCGNCLALFWAMPTCHHCLVACCHCLLQKLKSYKGKCRSFVGGAVTLTNSDKEREGKEGRRLKWILFNVFKTIIVECNGRNISGNGNNRFHISFFFSLSLSPSLSLSLPPVFCFIYYVWLIFFTFFSPPPPLGDGDYICAVSHRQHELYYIWDKATGNLVKILTGPKGESLLGLRWHPVKPVILSVSNGLVNILYGHTSRLICKVPMLQISNNL